MNEVERAIRTKGRRIELIIQQLESLPTLPAIAVRLLQVTVKKNANLTEVINLIEADPALAMKIIALVTRGGTGFKKGAITLKKAVVLLGFEAVRNAVLSIKVCEILSHHQVPDASGVDRVGLWKHSLAVACAAKMLAEHLHPDIESEEVFLCGLLHDIGKIALDTVLPKSFSRVVEITEAGLANISDVENRIMGLDHTIAGKRLAEKWNLPAAVLETIWLHQNHLTTMPATAKHQDIVQMVHVADALIREQRLGYSGNHKFEDSGRNLALALGCSEVFIEALNRNLFNLISERSGLIGLNDVEPEDLYRDALGQANRELGRLNDQLQVRNESLQVRSRYFDLLHQLSLGLADCRTMQDIYALVVGLWLRSTGAQTCALYVGADEHSGIEGYWTCAELTQGEPFYLDRNPDEETLPSVELAGAGFGIRKVKAEDFWFFEAVHPGFDLDATFLCPLKCGSHVLGGIFWQSEQELNHYESQLKEIEAFAAASALAVQNRRQQEQQKTMCEELTRLNQAVAQSQRELVSRQSLTMVGEMACGAAHEINNPLAVVVGRAQLLATDEPDEKRRKMLEAIIEHGKNISGIISSLLEFAKPDTPEFRPCLLKDLLDDAVTLCQRELPSEQIRFTIELEPNLPELNVDGAQISKAFYEIIRNAAEATNQPGTVEIQARSNEWDNTVLLIITDHGKGMGPETLAKALSPFYSEKTAGRRSGLGLSRAHRWIQNHQGTLTLQSHKDHGTTVCIELPVDPESLS